MAQNHQVELVVAKTGQRFRVWDEARITLDMLNAGSAWTFLLWKSSAPGNTWSEVRSAIKLGTTIQVYIDGAMQLEGRVSEAESRCSRSGACVFAVSGGDLSASLMKSHVDPKVRLKGRTLEDAIATVLADTSVKVVVSAEAEAAREVATLQRRGPRGTSRRRRSRRTPIDLYAIRPGQKQWDVCQDLAHKGGCLLWTGPTDGGVGLILDTPTQTGESLFEFRRVQQSDGRYSGNINESRHSRSIADVPTVISHRSHGGIDSDQTPIFYNAFNDEVAQSPFVDNEDGEMNFWIQLHLDSRRVRNEKEAQREVERQFAQANRAFSRSTVVVQGFGQNGKLYGLNVLCDLQDDAEEPKLAGQHLITRVSFAHSRQSAQTTELVLQPPKLLRVFPDEAA